MSEITSSNVCRLGFYKCTTFGFRIKTTDKERKIIFINTKFEQILLRFWIFCCPLNICLPIHCPEYTYYISICELLDVYILYHHTQSYDLQIFLNFVKAHKNTKILPNLQVFALQKIQKVIILCFSYTQLLHIN